MSAHDAHLETEIEAAHQSWLALPYTVRPEFRVFVKHTYPALFKKISKNGVLPDSVERTVRLAWRGVQARKLGVQVMVRYMARIHERYQEVHARNKRRGDTPPTLEQYIASIAEKCAIEHDLRQFLNSPITEE